jgi:hypothetical protein
MKDRRAPVWVLLATVLLGTALLPAAENSGLSDVEEEIWALEDVYISAFENAKHSEIASMLHRDFLGWPRESEKPRAKGDVAQYLKVNYPEPLEYRFELKRAGIRVSENIAVTHYLVVIRAKDEIHAGRSQTVRMTHTWLKEGAEWKILGGMSSTVRAVDP